MVTDSETLGKKDPEIHFHEVLGKDFATNNEEEVQKLKENYLKGAKTKSAYKLKNKDYKTSA